ncbi:MAG: hypothetical protein V1853_05340 [bacterium]
MEKVIYSQLDKPDQELLDKAEQAAEHGYNKESTIQVGAAIRSKKDNIYIGACVGRSRTSKQSRCGEEMALDQAVFNNDLDLESIAVMGKNHQEGMDKVISPCGSCRQLLFEVNPELRVILTDGKKEQVIVVTVKELLPLAY